MLKTVSSITNAIGALNYKGTWDANANSPALTSSVGTKGDYYVVSTAGATTLNGISNWGVGDWAAFNGSVWQRVEGGANLNGVDLSVSGNALIGTTTNTNSARLVVDGRIGFVDAAGSQSAVQFIPNKGVGAANSGAFGLSYNTVNFTPGSAPSNIYWDGGTGYLTISTSSQKYKRNITPVTDEQLDKALQINPSYYQRLEYDYWEYGFIAEQVNEVGLNEFVTKVDGEISGLNYEKMVVLAMGLIQRQQKTIDDLQSRISILENK
jgi:hypothetical protein